MTTAELIKKKEEEKNNPSQSPNTSPFKPAEGMNMAEARMAGNGVGQTETTTQVSEQVGNPHQGMNMAEARMAGNGISLYQDGVDKSNNTTSQKVDSKAVDEFYKTLNPQDFGVETPEQAEARERRDFIKQGLTGFTDGLTALANLYYTTKWAPNQKLVSQMPELSKRLYAERLERDKKLENFRAWQRDKADKDEEREYNLSLYNLKQEAANKAADKKAKLDEIKYLRDLGLIDARKEADLVKQKGKASLDKELEAIRQKNRVALADINNQAAMERVTSRGGGANATIRVPIGGDGEYAEYRKNDLTNPIVISQIYNSLPDDYRVREEKGIKTNEKGEMDPINGKYPFDDNPSTQKMQEAIGKALSDGYLTEMAPEIQIGGEKKKSGKKPIEGFSGEKQNSNKKTISGF